MQIAPKTLAQALVPETGSSPKGGQTGFDATLKAEQSKAQAPPGKEPPIKASPPNPEANVGGEVAKTEPNAQSQKLDSQPKQSADTQADPNSAMLVDSPSAYQVPVTIDALILASMPGFQQGALPLPPLTSTSIAKTTMPMPIGFTGPVVDSPASSPKPIGIVVFSDPLVPSTVDPTAGSFLNGAPAPLTIPSGSMVTSKLPVLQGSQKLDAAIARALNVKQVDVVAIPAADAVPVTTVDQAAPTAQATVQVAPTLVSSSTPMVQATVTPKVEATSVQATGKSVKSDVKTADSLASTNVEQVTAKSANPSTNGWQNDGSNQQKSQSDKPVELGAPDDDDQTDRKTTGHQTIKPIVLTNTTQSNSTTAVKDAKPVTTISNAQTNQVIRQASDRIALLAISRSKEAVTIHLSPPDLGDLTLVVRSAGGKVDADITATNDSVKQALQQHASQLGHSLSQRGLELNSVSVGTQGNHSTEGQSSARQQAQAQSQQKGTATATQVREAKGVSIKGQLQTSTVGVDYRI